MPSSGTGVKNMRETPFLYNTQLVKSKKMIEVSILQIIMRYVSLLSEAMSKFIYILM